MSSRGYLTRFYSFVYDALGQNIQATHIFYFFLLLLSAILFHLAFRRILGAPAALAGSLFYMAYASKFETVTWISAGGYLVVMCVLFLSVWIAVQPGGSGWTPAALITVLNWCAAHLYEFLIVAAPLYPALWLWRERSEARKIRWRGLVPTLLPLAMFLTHAALMYRYGNPARPLWMRAESNQFSALSALEALWNVFRLGLRGVAGRDHLSFLSLQIVDFLSIPKPYWLLWLSLLAAGILFGRICTKAAVAAPESPVPLRLLLAAALYLVLFAPLIGFTVVGTVLPSRLLSLPGAGLGVLAALLVHGALRWRNLFGRILLAGVAAAIALEAIAFQTVLALDQGTWAFDSSIREQLRRTGTRWQTGDTIFVSLPPAHPAWGLIWRGPSQVDRGDFQTLLLLDAGLAGAMPLRMEDRLFYIHEKRTSTTGLSLLLPPAALQHPDKVHPFFVRQQDFRLIGIRRVEYLDESGRLARSIDFPSVALMGPESTMVARLPLPENPK